MGIFDESYSSADKILQVCIKIVFYSFFWLFYQDRNVLNGSKKEVLHLQIYVRQSKHRVTSDMVEGYLSTGLLHDIG